MPATSTILFQTGLLYFSGALAFAFFFKFARLLSVRNGDVLLLFLPVPGLLLLSWGVVAPFWGYFCLLGASAFLLMRCLADLALVRRPALRPNINLGGMLWMACALFVGLLTLAVRKPDGPAESGGTTSTPLKVVHKGTEAIVGQTPAGADDSDVGLWAERGLTMACHLAIVVGLVLIGWRHFDDLHAGVAAAAFYLLLPYTYLLMPRVSPLVGRWDHAWPMALLVWVVLAFRRPTVAGAFLGLAAGTIFFPVLLLPVWFSFYRRRGASRFLLSFLLTAGVCLAVFGTIVWVNGELPHSLRTGWTSSAWKPWEQPGKDTQGLWHDIPTHWAYRLPVFLAYATLLVASAFWPAPKNLAHVIALSAGLLIGLQFWYADQGGVYVLWYLPYLLLLVFRPNLSSCQPAPPGEDWLTRLGQRLSRWLGLRRRQPPEPAGIS
jgi:hypothetical protein